MCVTGPVVQVHLVLFGAGLYASVDYLDSKEAQLSLSHLSCHLQLQWHPCASHTRVLEPEDCPLPCCPYS